MFYDFFSSVLGCRVHTGDNRGEFFFCWGGGGGGLFKRPVKQYLICVHNSSPDGLWPEIGDPPLP